MSGAVRPARDAQLSLIPSPTATPTDVSRNIAIPLALSSVNTSIV